ncbi:Nucleoredoxin-like protein 2 [Amphibalanus amphitrite]|uniref:Nucleoredoxin-like protein 2 n=1 Tax=Amphibalanus amphitrite TaxID=1232801 RepID=A0A6A4W663_AMPAM|nr:Nucleoredoxin-like protein 2 [Amphibalanus amphitrite]
MDTLKSTQLQKGASGGLVAGSEALAGKKVIGIYFSAHWCPPCRMFTPVLKDFYEALLESGCELEVVFVSSDRSPADMAAYMNEAHGEWLAVPHGSPAAQQLKTEFQVSGIPTLVFLRADGTVAERDGRSVVQGKGPTKACDNNHVKRN